jgi:hypothetical protein
MSFIPRNLLTPFFKLAHPDLLANAPRHVKETNAGALSNLNSYIDSVKNGQDVNIQTITFYIPEEDSLSYAERRVTLLPVQKNATERIKKIQVENTIKAILASIQTEQSVFGNSRPDPASIKRPKYKVSYIQDIEAEEQQQNIELRAAEEAKQLHRKKIRQ